MKAQVPEVHLRKNIVLFLLPFFIMGCASYDKYHYDQARAFDTVGAYEQYLEKYPKGRYRTAALSAMDDLTFRKAEAHGAVLDYRHYLSKFPNGKHCKEALSAIDEFSFRWAENQNTLTAYENYVSSFKDGGAHFEEALWRLAELEGTKEAFIKFSRKFPYSHKRILAKAKIAYFDAKKYQSIKSLTLFFNLYHKHYPSTISGAEYNEILALLSELAQTKERPEFNILLFKETREKKYLQWGLDHRHKVANAEDESIFAAEFPELYFDFKGCGLQENDDDSRIVDGKMVPAYGCAMQSLADYGVYRIKLKLTINVTEETKFIRYYSQKNIKKKTEAVFREEEIIISEKSLERFQVIFPEIVVSEDKRNFFGNGEIVRRGIEGLPEHEILDVSLLEIN